MYIPKNPSKYIHINNKMNESNKFPIYRSSWELKFFKYCDLNDDIRYWTSEPIGIEYYNPIKEKICKYYPDFLISYTDKNILVEIKPKSQTYAAHTAYDKEQLEINKAKWEAAQKFCDERGIKFVILTENELGINKPKKPRRARKGGATLKERSFI